MRTVESTVSTTFETTEVYLSGGICGHLWMPCALAGKPISKSARGPWGFYNEGDTWRDALDGLLMREGGDFQDAKFTADTELVVVRRRVVGNGRYELHTRTRELAQLHDCADLVTAESYTGDFMGDED